MAVAGSRNCRTKTYRQQLDFLPEKVRDLADKAFNLFLQDPTHPMLANHELGDNHRGQHRKKSRAVSITQKYRAIYALDEDTDTNVWYWVGSHSDYDVFTGGK